MRIPDTEYIGQPKTGSTFLRGYFSQHPKIAWRRNATMFQANPFVREKYLSLFTDEAECDCLVDMYEGLAVGYSLGKSTQWDAAVALVPDHPLDGRSMIPGQRDTAERILSLPDARILLTLRNQVDWLRSSYLHYMLGMPPSEGDFWISCIRSKAN